MNFIKQVGRFYLKNWQWWSAIINGIVFCLIYWDGHRGAAFIVFIMENLGFINGYYIGKKLQ